MSEKKKRPSYGYTNEDFASLWNKCESVKEVSDAISMPMPSCQTKAAILRKKGLNLKLFKRGRRVATPVSPEELSGLEPQTESYDALNKQLEQVGVGGVIDIVWGPAETGTTDTVTTGGSDAA